MKTILTISAWLCFTCLLMTSCSKDENKVYLQGGTAPALTTQTGSDVTYANASLSAVTLSWTNPSYMFNTGVSSLNVTYNIEIDTASNFSNPAKKTIAVSQALSYTISVSELNDIMLNQLQLKAEQPHTLVMRVISNLANSTGVLSSNSAQLTATPYKIPPKVEIPSTDRLFITGSATGGGWMAGGDSTTVPANQEFTQVSDTKYVLTLNLSGGNEYLFVPKKGDWAVKYGAVASTTDAGGGFQYNNGANFKAPAASGKYEIEVDFQRGVFTVTSK